MKKLFLTFGVCAMLVAMASCGGDKEKTSKSSESSEGVENVSEGGSESSSTEAGGSQSGDSYSSGSSSSEGDFNTGDLEDAMRDATHENIDRAHEMINDELDKHGLAGKAAKGLYDQSAKEMHNAVDEEFGSSSDDED